MSHTASGIWLPEIGVPSFFLRDLPPLRLRPGSPKRWREGGGLFAFQRVLPPLAPIVLPDDREDDHRTRRIRCPRCQWVPESSSRWSCLDSRGYPEYFDGGCGTSWNTFQTRGKCPGCSHQWKWTICLACAVWSIHGDWYE